MQLRGLCVREWKANPHEYEGFVPNTDVAAEADKFMESGFFYGELGNTMILSLSNALGLPLIIFSAAIYHPLINITPRHLRASIPHLISMELAIMMELHFPARVADHTQ